MPAKAGIQESLLNPWIPAFAGMTNKEKVYLFRVSLTACAIRATHCGDGAIGFVSEARPGVRPFLSETVRPG